MAGCGASREWGDDIKKDVDNSYVLVSVGLVLVE